KTSRLQRPSATYLLHAWCPAAFKDSKSTPPILVPAIEAGIQSVEKYYNMAMDSETAIIATCYDRTWADQYKLLPWPEFCVRFRAAFVRDRSRRDRRDDWLRLRHTGSVMEYNQAFRVAAVALGYAVDDIHALDHWEHHLQPAFLDRLASELRNRNAVGEKVSTFEARAALAEGIAATMAPTSAPPQPLHLHALDTTPVLTPEPDYLAPALKLPPWSTQAATDRWPMGIGNRWASDLQRVAFAMNNAVRLTSQTSAAQLVYGKRLSLLPPIQTVEEEEMWREFGLVQPSPQNPRRERD
ncbi:hypothetical protein B9479_007863, partial [Cryptococcus floricola]